MSCSMDAETLYCELRTAVLKYGSLMNATASSASGPAAMDIGSLANSGDAEEEETWPVNWREENGTRKAPKNLCSL